MKSIILAVLALAISSEASYPYAPAQPVAPAVIPTLYHNLPTYTATYPAAAPEPVYVLPHEPVRPLAYTYQTPVHHVVSAPLPAAVSHVAVSGVVSSPAVTTRVVTHELPTIVAPEPIVVKNYDYQLPEIEKVVIPEFRKPIVPHTTYGVPY